MGDLLNELNDTAKLHGGQRNQLREFFDSLTADQAADVLDYLRGGRNMSALQRLAADRFGFRKNINTWHTWSMKTRAGEYDDYEHPGG